jgi:hypothetical protein
MTAQISDTFVYREREYSLAGINGSGLFDPAEHGIIACMLSTACWRGYYCTYEVTNGALFLTQLNIGLSRSSYLVDVGEGPILFGRTPSQYTLHSWNSYLKEDKPSQLVAECFFDNLREFVPLTGGVLLGADFIHKMYFHGGFQPAYKFHTVYELIFEKGKLVKEVDRSAEMTELREAIAHWPRKEADLIGLEELSPAVAAWLRKEYALLEPSYTEIEEWMKKYLGLDYKWLR